MAADPSNTPISAGISLRLTPDGDRVLRGEADHVTLNGVDPWICGLHLADNDARLCWDKGTEFIV